MSHSQCQKIAVLCTALGDPKIKIALIVDAALPLHDLCVTHMVTYEWVMSRMGISHVTRSNESCHTQTLLTALLEIWRVTWRVLWHVWMSHVTSMNESCHTDVACDFTCSLALWRDVWLWIMYEWVMSHICMGHVTCMNKSCHIYDGVMSYRLCLWLYKHKTLLLTLWRDMWP